MPSSHAQRASPNTPAHAPRHAARTRGRQPHQDAATQARPGKTRAPQCACVRTRTLHKCTRTHTTHAHAVHAHTHTPHTHTMHTLCTRAHTCAHAHAAHNTHKRCAHAHAHVHTHTSHTLHMQDTPLPRPNANSFRWARTSQKFRNSDRPFDGGPGPAHVAGCRPTGDWGLVVGGTRRLHPRCRSGPGPQATRAPASSELRPCLVTAELSLKPLQLE